MCPDRVNEVLHMPPKSTSAVIASLGSQRRGMLTDAV